MISETPSKRFIIISLRSAFLKLPSVTLISVYTFSTVIVYSLYLFHQFPFSCLSVKVTVTISPEESVVCTESPSLKVVGTFTYSPFMANKFKCHSCPSISVAPVHSSLLNLNSKVLPAWIAVPFPGDVIFPCLIEPLS